MATFGLVPAAHASLVIIAAVQVLNGWVQGMGWPPCGKSMVHWFSTRERGFTVSVWNTAHNVGKGLVPRSRSSASRCFTTGTRSSTSMR